MAVWACRPVEFRTLPLPQLHCAVGDIERRAGSFAESRAAGGAEAISRDPIGDDHRRADEEQANDRSPPFEAIR